MLRLITGGSASGKSAFAERLLEENAERQREAAGQLRECEEGTGPELIYLATMAARDEESLERIQRHVRQRSGKGYRTLEISRDIGSAAGLIGQESFVLIEDIPNLCANEMFSDDGSICADPSDSIIEGIEGICRKCLKGEVIAVTGELFSDGTVYEGETLEYLKLLARVNYELAARASSVYEIVCKTANRLK